eukprot:s812_g7.t1
MRCSFCKEVRRQWDLGRCNVSVQSASEVREAESARAAVQRQQERLVLLYAGSPNPMVWRQIHENLSQPGNGHPEFILESVKTTQLRKDRRNLQFQLRNAATSMESEILAPKCSK